MLFNVVKNISTTYQNGFWEKPFKHSFYLEGIWSNVLPPPKTPPTKTEWPGTILPSLVPFALNLQLKLLTVDKKKRECKKQKIKWIGSKVRRIIKQENYLTIPQYKKCISIVIVLPENVNNCQLDVIHISCITINITTQPHHCEDTWHHKSSYKGKSFDIHISYKYPALMLFKLHVYEINNHVCSIELY